MKFINSNRYRNMLGIISITKLIILLFILSTILSNMFNGADITNYTSIAKKLMFSMSSALLVAIFLWCFSYVYMFKLKRLTIALIIEDTAFVILLSIFMIFSDSYKSYNKYLFLFSIISTTISFGKRMGLITAILSGGIVLSIDLYFAPGMAVNTYFENDIMLILAFIVLSWILGEYKMFENDQREFLESELKEKLEQYNKIDYMLLKNQDSFNLIIRQSDYAILVHDEERILYLNKKALELLGIDSFDKIESKPLLYFIETEDEAKIKKTYNDIINEHVSNISFKEKLVNYSKKEINVQNSSNYFVYEKTPAILTIMRDISSEIHVEQLKEDVKENVKLLKESKEQNKFITDFFANMSHELKTPLNIIFSSLHMLNIYNENSELEYVEKRKKYLHVMKQNSYRLIRLINNILDVTKYDSGFITLRLKNGNIISLIEDITMSIVSFAEDKGIDVIFDTDVEERIIAFDDDKIEKIILNLISNSLKFTNPGGQIYVTIFNKENEVEVSVKDTGIGIPEDNIDSIFDRFVQVDKTLKRNKEGSGIGLSLVQSFVRLHGGEVRVESEFGHGSEFIFTIPAAQINENYAEDQIRNNIDDRVNMELSDIYSNE
ncbi:PAS domain-containing sensor histidine kinase [Clostridium sp.]|uniref:PAS domain-containing sensor histidine kinase n=1 Tax=Clostridium sp. TaxID=1506 RepID=UPI00284F5D9A|nr:PAS domain-containing sensor histidine kinase [Clostridium sp.]MDR3596232.1 PAS domain-containing sensor histidine kinase [Clostridium sp.]